jgi:hypothetical protein
MTPMREESLIPVLRVGNANDAVVWYRRLGFAVRLEHSRGPGFSRTDVVVKRGELRLILSEGDEDVPPDGVVCLQVAEISAVAKEFNVEIRKDFLRQQIDLRDPYGNLIRVIALDSFTPEMRPMVDQS